MSKFTPLIIAICCLFLPFGPGGCGGSTSGTGGTRIQGLVLNQNQAAFANATVTLLNTGSTTITDAAGQFQILESVSGDLQFEFVRGDLTAQATVSGIDPDSVSVEVTFRVDERNNTAEPTEVKQRKRGEDSSAGSGDDDDDNGGGGVSGDDDDDNSGPGGGTAVGDDDDDDGGGSGGGSVGDDDDDNAGTPGESPGSGGGSGSGDDDDDSVQQPGGGAGGDSSSDDDDDSSQQVEVEGSITAISSSSITVDGATFSITAQTEFDGANGDSATWQDFAVGDSVAVKGFGSGGSLVAEKVELKD